MSNYSQNGGDTSGRVQRSSRFSIFERSLFVIITGMFLTGVLFFFLKFSFETKEKPSLIIYSYSDMLSHEVVEEFERTTGITVNVKHFEAVEELMTMLVFAKESSCDVVISTEAMVETLIQANLIEPLDRTKLTYYDQLDPRLFGQFYDPTNTYVVPFSWAITAFGYDRRVITAPPETIGLDLLFGKPGPDGAWLCPADIYGPGVVSVCMGEDPWEAIFLGSQYLFHTIHGITFEQREEILKLLCRQRAWLESYTNNMKYFLISRIAPVVVMPSAHAADLHKEYPFIDFVIPHDGGLLIMGELCIPRSSKQKEKAFELINYLLSPEANGLCAQIHLFHPSNVNSYAYLPEWMLDHPYLSPTRVDPRSLVPAHNELVLQDVEQLWYRLKL